MLINENTIKKKLNLLIGIQATLESINKWYRSTKKIRLMDRSDRFINSSGVADYDQITNHNYSNGF